MSSAAGSDAHRVVAALADDDSAGKGLVVDFNPERPVPAIERVLLEEVQVIHTCDLHTGESLGSFLHPRSAAAAGRAGRVPA